MAVGGETLESIDGVFYVNGRELAPEYYPLTTRYLPRSFKIVCPKNGYIVLISSQAEEGGIISKLRHGGTAKAPGLGGEEWAQACVIEKKAIYDRSLFIYTPALRRRMLKARGPRFQE